VLFSLEKNNTMLKDDYMPIQEAQPVVNERIYVATPVQQWQHQQPQGVGQASRQIPGGYGCPVCSGTSFVEKRQISGMQLL